MATAKAARPDVARLCGTSLLYDVDCTRGRMTFTSSRRRVDWAKYPFVVKVYTPGRGGGVSSGTAVSRRHVLTAAHCVTEHDWSPLSKDNVKISLVTGEQRAGEDLCSVAVPDETGVRYDASGDGFRCDVALLECAQDLQVPTVDLIDIKEERTYGSGTAVILCGFGSWDGAQEGHEHLYESVGCFGRIHKVEDTDYYHSRVLATNADSRPGDSGGPLLVAKENRYVQIGVNSQNHLLEGKYRRGAVLGLGVSTRICDARIHDWIARRIGER